MDKVEYKSYEVLGKLPDPFLFEDGSYVKTKEDWQKRRKEIYKTAVELQYGKIPPQPEFLEFHPLRYTYYSPCDYLIKTGRKEKPVFLNMQIFHPEGQKGKFPVVVCGDLGFKYVYDKEFISAFVDNGIALAVFDRSMLAPDRDTGRKEGQLYETYPDYNFGAVGAWAWGFSRCVDVLEKLDFIDTSMIAFAGHSRGGKAAMLAGVLDERAAIVAPNGSGCAGCGCYRIHASGIRTDGEEQRNETLKDMSGWIHFWLNEEVFEYKDCEEKLPFDQHYLKALVAPRVLLMTEAEDDLWANPIGTVQTSIAAREVYKFLDVEENIFWRFRKGVHYHEIADLNTLVGVIKHKKYGEALPKDLFNVPFDVPEPIYDWKCPER